MVPRACLVQFGLRGEGVRRTCFVKIEVQATVRVVEADVEATVQRMWVDCWVRRHHRNLAKS